MSKANELNLTVRLHPKIVINNENQEGIENVSFEVKRRASFDILSFSQC